MLLRAETAVRLKVGMVSDTARFDDAGFNHSCSNGLARAMRELNVEGCFRESRRQDDYGTNLDELVQSGCGLIFGIGAQMHADMARVAEKNPKIKFAVVDSAFYPPLYNVQSITFNVEEAAFLAGYLAAAWADFKDPKDPVAGFIGGVKIEPVEQFVVPYQAGAEYFNRKYRKTVQIRGGYAGTFEDRPKGKTMGEALVAGGADVIFGVGGQTGAGALAAASEKGKWGIGVDVDQYVTLPDVKGCLLSSCLKNMDNAVYALIQNVLADKFQGGGNMVGTLANGGVGLAPYHDFTNQIPVNIKQDLDELQLAIKGNKLATGWPPSIIIPW